MNELIRKEIRLVAPAWLATVLLAIVPIWLLPDQWGIQDDTLVIAAISFFAFGAVLLGVSAFGQEFGIRTFSLLLVQPVSRIRLWEIKAAVTAIALAMAVVALCGSAVLR